MLKRDIQFYWNNRNIELQYINFCKSYYNSYKLFLKLKEVEANF